MTRSTLVVSGSDTARRWHSTIVDVVVPAGTVTALLGHNGAGKTTAVRILTTLAAPDEGVATVAGFDVRREPHEVRRRIGLAAQDATIDPYLTGRENLVLLAELHQLSRRDAKSLADELLEQFGLSDDAERVTSGYSGGMRRRLDLAATLAGSPQVLFLDEPTTGLDPRARLELWDAIGGLVERGASVLLTTQYLEEAERLADDIVVFDHGRVIAHGDPRTLKRQVGGDRVHVTVADVRRLPAAIDTLRSMWGTVPSSDVASRSVAVPSRDGIDGLLTAARRLTTAGIDIDDISLRQPTLDEVFLRLTGTPHPASPSTSDVPA